MACLTKLKQDIKLLERAFPKESDRSFRILSASVDEINCVFIDESGGKHRINANITVRNYFKLKVISKCIDFCYNENVNKGCFVLILMLTNNFLVLISLVSENIS